MQDEDKEAQLSQALMSDNPVTDLPLAVEVDYFRLEKTKYFVPITAKIPGSALAFQTKGSKQATELDFIAEVTDSRKRPAATVRDTVPLKIASDVAGQVAQKSIQYDTGVTLTPGTYKLHFLARENGEGKVGTYEASFTIPDLSNESVLRVSSLILSNQRGSVSDQVAGVKNSKKLLAFNPLIQDGQKLVPNVTKVFRSGQNVLAYLEIYDPKLPESVPENFQRPVVEASLAFYRDGKKAFETPSVRANRLLRDRQQTLALWLQMPVTSLQPGSYECQLNVIDELGRKFAFPHAPLSVLPIASSKLHSQQEQASPAS